MPQTRPNGITVPTNPDNFQNLPNDLATMADSANVVIAVQNQAARDALTKKVGLAVTRQDLNQLVEVCDGTNWQTMAKIKHAEFTAPSVTATTAGNGYNFGIFAATTDSTTQNNSFCQQDAVNIGRIKILEAGVYAVAIEYLPTSTPGNMDLGITAGGSRSDNFAHAERVGSYGYSGGTASNPGIYFASGDVLTPYVTVSNSNVAFTGRIMITKIQG